MFRTSAIGSKYRAMATDPKAETNGNPIDPGVDIGHVHLKVADIDRALGFYRDVLGFEVTQRYGTERRVHLRRRLPPPHRPQHLGERGRQPAAARHDRPLPPRDPLPDPRRARRRAAAPDRGRHPARRRQRSRRQRGALSARPRRERRRALLGPPARPSGPATPTAASRCSRAARPRGVAARGERRLGHELADDHLDLRGVDREVHRA